MTGGAQRSQRRGWAEALVESQAGAGGTLCPLKGSRLAGPGCRDEPAVSRGMQGHKKEDRGGRVPQVYLLLHSSSPKTSQSMERRRAWL